MRSKAAAACSRNWWRSWSRVGRAAAGVSVMTGAPGWRIRGWAYSTLTDRPQLRGWAPLPGPIAVHRGDGAVVAAAALVGQPHQLISQVGGRGSAAADRLLERAVVNVGVQAVAGHDQPVAAAQGQVVAV